MGSEKTLTKIHVIKCVQGSFIPKVQELSNSLSSLRNYKLIELIKSFSIDSMEKCLERCLALSYVIINDSILVYYKCMYIIEFVYLLTW